MSNPLNNTYWFGYGNGYREGYDIGRWKNIDGRIISIGFYVIAAIMLITVLAACTETGTRYKLYELTYENGETSGVSQTIRCRVR